MTEIHFSLEQLRGLIGQSIRYRGTHYVVIEILEDGPALVAQSVTEERSIQADLHGRPRRQVQETVTIPVLHADRVHLHTEFLEVDLL